METQSSGTRREPEDRVPVCLGAAAPEASGREPGGSRMNHGVTQAGCHCLTDKMAEFFLLSCEPLLLRSHRPALSREGAGRG